MPVTAEELRKIVREMRDWLHGLDQRTDEWSQSLWCKAWDETNSLERAADALEAAEKQLEGATEAWAIRRPNGTIANGTNSTFPGGSWKQYLGFHGGHQEYYEQQGFRAGRILILEAPEISAAENPGGDSCQK